MREEMKKCFDRGQFKAMFLFIYIITVISFIAESMMQEKASLFTSLRSSYESTFMTGINSFIGVIVMLLPVISGLIYADSYVEDRACGIHNYIASRCEMEKYLKRKAKIIVFATFMTFMIPMLLNLILSNIIFPQNGYESIFGIPMYALCSNYNKEILFDSLRIDNPCLYNILFAFLISLFASLFSLIIYGLLFFTKDNKLKTIFSVYIIYLAWEIFLGVLDFEKLSLFSYMWSYRKGNIIVMFTYIIGFLILGLVLTGIGIRKEIKDIGI